MTADDYQRKMDAVNKLMHERSPFRFKVCGPFWAYFVVAVAFFATMMIIFYRLATTECREPNGMCPTSRTDATDGQCCNFWCCSTEFNDLLANASARSLEDPSGYSALLVRVQVRPMGSFFMGVRFTPLSEAKVDL